MVAPSKFAHVVYNTHRYAEMVDWYTRVFEARAAHAGERLTSPTPGTGSASCSTPTSA